MFKSFRLFQRVRNASLFAIGGAMILVFALLGGLLNESIVSTEKTSHKPSPKSIPNETVRHALDAVSHADRLYTGRFAKYGKPGAGFLILLARTEYWDEFSKMTKTGTPPGRVYGAMLLQSVDTAKAKPILDEMLSDNAEFEKHTSCLAYPTTVKEQVAQLLNPEK